MPGGQPGTLCALQRHGTMTARSMHGVVTRLWPSRMTSRLRAVQGDGRVVLGGSDTRRAPTVTISPRTYNEDGSPIRRCRDGPSCGIVAPTQTSNGLALTAGRKNCVDGTRLGKTAKTLRLYVHTDGTLRHFARRHDETFGDDDLETPCDRHKRSHRGRRQASVWTRIRFAL